MTQLEKKKKKKKIFNWHTEIFFSFLFVRKYIQTRVHSTNIFFLISVFWHLGVVDNHVRIAKLDAHTKWRIRLMGYLSIPPQQVIRKQQVREILLHVKKKNRLANWI